MAQPTIIFFGAQWSPDSHRVRHFLGEHGLSYEWKNVDEPAAAAELKNLAGNQTVPALVIDGKLITAPGDEELAKLCNTTTRPVANYHDVIIIGGGPTALAAAIYTTREDIDTVILEKGVVGGLAAITDVIENYPGFPKGIAGMELSQALRQQAERFGTKIELAEVQQVIDHGQYKKLVTTNGEYLARAVLIATGNDYVRLGVPGEEEFFGRGVHYCATCDGPLYRDKRLVVVGSGNSAAQEGLFLTKFATQVDILIRGGHWKASEILVENIEKNPKIKVHFNTETARIEGKDGLVTKVVANDKQANKQVEFPADGVFVFVGLKPNTTWVDTQSIKLDGRGFIETTKMLETAQQGVFAAGDVRSGATQQIASAVGEGATAALMIREYLKEQG